MENVAVEKKQTGETPSVARAMWDPFWFMHEMFGWGRSVGVPSFDVKETGDAYIYKVKLTVPGQADVARVKAEFNNGELTVVVPKASTSTPEPVLRRVHVERREPSWNSSGYASTPSAYPITSRLG